MHTVDRPSQARVTILYVITQFVVGGATETALFSVEGLRKDGCDASIITGPKTGAEGELFSEAERRNVPVEVLGALVRPIRPIKDLHALVALYGRIRRARPAIVHTHSSKAGVLGRIAARMAGVPVVVHTIHGWSFNSRQSAPVRALFIFLERFCARRSDCLVAVSKENIEEGLANRIGRREQYELVRSGIDVAEYEDPERRASLTDLGIPDGSPVVGTVARLSQQKCPADFVRVAKAVRAEVPDAHFVYVGDGPLRQDVERQIVDGGLSGAVHLLGVRHDVPELLPLFDVFLSTSLWEGLPRTFLQAMAAGKPIVSTRVPGAIEVIEPGVSGYVAELGDVESMSKDVIGLLRDPELARRMGAAGRQKLTDEFTVAAMVEGIESLYAHLSESKGLHLERGPVTR